MDLETALERATALYEQEQLAEIPLNVAAKDLGYKSANNGAAMSTFATMRYFGLIERSSTGKLRVSKDVRRYRYAPDEESRARLRTEWFRKPALFADLLDTYPEGLPSDATVRFHLIEELGFRPAMAETVLSVFKKSLAFAGTDALNDVDEDIESVEDPDVVVHVPAGRAASPRSASTPPEPDSRRPAALSATTGDQEIIPIRLSGGRRAWISLPEPFYEADKTILKNQIDLVLVDEEP